MLSQRFFRFRLKKVFDNSKVTDHHAIIPTGVYAQNLTDMEQLVESIKRNGVMTPATVRLKDDGRYELISGHRRKKACAVLKW